jgi:hypothetical protein
MWPIVWWALLALAVRLLYWLTLPILQHYTGRHATAYQHSYVDPMSHMSHGFPSVFDAPTKYLSLIAPAYNESARLPEMIQAVRPHANCTPHCICTAQLRCVCDACARRVMSTQRADAFVCRLSFLPPRPFIRSHCNGGCRQ